MDDGRDGRWTRLTFAGPYGPPADRETVSPRINSTKNVTMNMKNRILAISIDAPAIPVKPRTPATNPTRRKNNAQRNIAVRSMQSHIARNAEEVFRVPVSLQSKAPPVTNTV